MKGHGGRVACIDACSLVFLLQESPCCSARVRWQGGLQPVVYVCMRPSPTNAVSSRQKDQGAMPWSGMQPVTACSVQPRLTVLVVCGIQPPFAVWVCGMCYVSHINPDGTNTVSFTT